jgi:large subunit ribosomal protein L23
MTEAPDSYRVILRPALTEKSTEEQETLRTYRFEVAPEANKIQIAEAVERLFDVKVEAVRTQIRPGKPRRRGWTSFHSPARKIAVVKVAEGGKIELL